MKKYLISGFNTVQDVKLEAGTYTLVAYAKSMYSNVYTFALGDGENWTEYDIDVVQCQLCKVWLTFTIDKKATKFKPIANNFSESLPVYVADLQLTKGNIPVEAGASPFDIDQILNDLHDGIDAIEDFTEGAFLDGLLSREEKTQLRASLDSIGVIVESVKGSYNKLLDNPFIHENTMDNITARYYAFIASWISDGDPRGLKPVILWIVKGDHIVSQNEREEKDRALNAFNDALYAYNQAEKEVYNDVGENSIAPVIIDGFWAFWDSELQEFVKSEFSSIGDDAHAPIIRDGYWHEWNPALEGEDKYQTTGVRAEGVKGDGAIEKFKSSATQPPTPTGDALDWSFTPDIEEEPSAPEIVGDNLFSLEYLHSTGWSAYVANEANIEDIPAAGKDVINPSVFKPNTQYRIVLRGYSTSTKMVVRYTDGTTYDSGLIGGDFVFPYDTAEGKTVSSIKVGPTTYMRLYRVTVFYELSSVSSDPIWVTVKSSVKGVESGWSTPREWTGRIGKDGRDGVDGKDGVGVRIVGSKATKSQLPSTWHTLGDGFITEDDGHLHVWNGSGWTDVGRIQGRTSYFHQKWSNDGGKTFTANGGDTVGSWMGTCVTFDPSPPTNTSAYKWVRAEGEKGEKGEKGDDGTSVRIVGKRDTKANLPETWSVLGDGFITEDTGHLHVWDGSGDWIDVGKIQGDTSYFHVKYSNDGGETFTSNNGEDLGSWMGTYVDFIEEDSDDPTDYKWIRVEGVKGDDGANYLPMGEWDSGTAYEKTLMGIPLVKVYAGGDYQVYTLHLKEGVSKNVKPWESFSGENRHWDLADTTSGLTYMERAYAERLQAEIIDTVLLNADTVQAELITAEKIEALDITARKLKTPSTVVTTANFQSQLIQANSVIIQDQGSIPVTYDWNTVYLPNGEQYDGLKAQIYAPTGTYKRIRIKTSDGGLLFINNTEVAVGKIELAFTTMATIHLTAMWNPTHSALDWIITYYQVYRLSNAVQTNRKRLPVILWSGDSLFSGTIPKSGVLPTDSLGVLTTINSNWLRGFTCSKNSENMYSIKINTPFHYGTSSSVSPHQTITSGDIEVSINPSNKFSPINTYIAVYGQYEYTEIRVWFSNPSTPSTYIEQDFAITVRANRPIVQDEYLTSTIE